MPFHPTCFEIFTRLSRLHFGHVDIKGLAGWRRLESDYASDRSFPRHPTVLKGYDQWWLHQRGDAWLAANPVLVPSLRSLLFSVVQSQVQRSVNGPFSKLPQELLDAILDLLSPLDMASLRLASCVECLPFLHWRHLLEEEMPWLWELWDDVEPSFWATISVFELREEETRRDQAKKADEETQRRFHEQRAIVKDEMPETLEAWSQDHQYIEKPYMTPPKPQAELPVISSTNTINWCRVYYEVKIHWDELRGLRNRCRIWADIQEILRRIEEYRRGGRI